MTDIKYLNSYIIFKYLESLKHLAKLEHEGLYEEKTQTHTHDTNIVS